MPNLQVVRGLGGEAVEIRLRPHNRSKAIELIKEDRKHWKSSHFPLNPEIVLYDCGEKFEAGLCFTMCKRDNFDPNEYTFNRVISLTFEEFAQLME